jgi:hypothetical protein
MNANQLGKTERIHFINQFIQFKPIISRSSTYGLPRKEKLPRTQGLRMIRVFLLISLISACFALPPAAQAVIPAPDGAYPGGNTAEGDAALFNLTTGTSNTAIGDNALFLDTTGSLNTATGANALVNNTTGSRNTGTGFNALAFNEIGSDNTATGFDALSGNGNTGSNNTADGSHALVNNNSGGDDTAIGFQALGSNTTGNLNTATGVNALFNNTTGGNNTATGVAALFHNTTGNNNTANGVDALASNGNGGNNTANGFDALFSNTTGNNNTADGGAALQNNATGRNNTADGFQALSNNTIGSNDAGSGVNALFSNTTGNLNVAVGVNSLLHNTTGSSNIALGFNAGSNLTIGNSNIDIGNAGIAAEANTVRLGTQGTQRRTFIAGISGTAVSGLTVVVNASGQVGVAASSERFKDEIKPMNKASEAILALEPVTFRYKRDIDPDHVLQFGLVAEEVAKVNPNLVARDTKGEVYAVRYGAVNAMLLNEFLKEHRKVEQLAKDFESKLAEQQKQIEALTAGLQKVSAQLALRKPAPQSVLNH